MSRLTIAAQTIKDTISAKDLGQAIGIPLRNGRCQCPFHGGKDYNCVLYSGSRGWYCHVCKEGGDVISFAQQYYKMPFKECIVWFSDTFHMGLNLSGKIDPQKQKQAEMALQMRKNAIEFQRWKDRMAFDLYLLAEKIVDRLEELRDTRRPRTYGEWDPEFCIAVGLLPDAIAFAEECLLNCTKEEK